MVSVVSLEKKAREVSAFLSEPGWMLDKRLEAVFALQKLKSQREEELRIKREAAKKGSLAQRMAQTVEMSVGANEPEGREETAAYGSASEYAVPDFEVEKGTAIVKAKLEGKAMLQKIEQAYAIPEFEKLMRMPLSGKEPEGYLASLALFSSGNAVFVEADGGAPSFVSIGIFGAPPQYFCTFILAGKGCNASVLVKTALSSDAKECRGLFLSKNSKVHACFVQENDAGVCATLGMVARLGEHSQLKFLNSNIGGSEKHDGFLFLQDERGSSCEHFEASLAKGRQKYYKDSDHLHIAPDTYSRSVFKYATADNSIVDVEGKVTIEQTAPGSDTHLLARSLLLSEHSILKVVPMLFVRNAEVAAGHGSAMTPLQDEELFYLRSRGIGENESKLLVLQGFLQDALNKSGMDPKMLTQLEQDLDENALSVFPRD